MALDPRDAIIFQRRMAASRGCTVALLCIHNLIYISDLLSVEIKKNEVLRLSFDIQDYVNFDLSLNSIQLML